jgi:hypothetical protein
MQVVLLIEGKGLYISIEVVTSNSLGINKVLEGVVEYKLYIIKVH